MGYGVGDHGTAAQLLEGRHALIDEGHNFLLAQLLARLGHDVRARHLPWSGSGLGSGLGWGWGLRLGLGLGLGLGFGRKGHLTRDLVKLGDDGGVGDLRVRTQEILELRRRDLVR